LDLDLDEPRKTHVAAMQRWDVDVDDLVRVRIDEPIHRRDVASRRLRLRRIREDVSSARERRRVSGVLFVASFDEHHPDIERQRRDQQDRDQGTREQDEDLAAFIVVVPSGAASC